MSTEPPNTQISALSSLTTEQLRKLLQAQLEEAEPDVELIQKVSALLEQREPVPFDPDSAFHAFKEDPDLEPIYSVPQEEAPPVKRPRVLRLARVGTVAAVIALVLLLGTAVSYAMGFDLLGAVVRWSADTFGFSDKSTLEQAGRMDTEDPYYSLRQPLREAGFSQYVVPRFLPEGYVCVEANQDDTFEGVSISGIYSNGKNYIILHYLLFSGQDPEKKCPIDNLEPEIYSVGGIEHYIMTNEAEYTAIWSNGNVLCQISGVIDKEELLDMLDSIYEEVSQP